MSPIGLKREIRRVKQQHGFTLLEYAAGAAVIAAIMFASMNGLATQVQTNLNAVSRQLGAVANAGQR
jgi:Flp pilus assembly pilin Flp